MAKLNSLFKYDGTFGGVTVVRSRAYGNHIRKARTKFTLSEGMKKSSGLMKQANAYAKPIKDAIDPYRRDFRDGMLWQRLVSIFKTQLQEKGSADFSDLEGQELNKIHPLSILLSTQTTVSESGGTLTIKATSRYSKDPTRGRADGYQQTLIILFLDAGLQATTFSESIIFPLKEDASEQQVTWAIPVQATTAIIIIKCDFCSKQKPLGLQKGMGMRVVKVVKIGEGVNKNRD